MSSKSISVWKALAFQIMMMLAIALILPLSATAQLRINQAGKQQNKPLTQAQASSNRQVADSKATEPAKQDPKADNGSPFDAVRGKKEDTSKRDLYSKHYKNDDGSYTALIGAGPIHFEKGGQFYDIDHNITANGDASYPYSNTTNLFESYFGATAHKGVKNKTVEGEIKEFLNTKMYWEVNGQAVNTQTSSDAAVSVQGDKAYYHNLFGNISAEFITLSGKRKLNYVIPNAQALGSVPANANYLTFTEDVVLPQGWTHTVSDGGIYIKNQSGENIYLYENPVSIDASDNLEREQNTIFETSLNGNILTIKTKVKTSWLLNSERQFPVMVDPTFTQTIAGASETGRAQSNGAGAYGIIRFGRQSGLWVLGYISYNLASWNPSWVATDVSITLSGTSNGTMHASAMQQIQRVTFDPSAYGTWASYYTAQNGMSFYGQYTGAGNFSGTKNLGATAVTQFTSDVGTAYKKFTVGFRAGGTWNNDSFINWTTATLNVTYTEGNTPPSCATLIGPANGGTGIAHQGNLAWNVVGGATSYDVYFGTAGSPPLVSTSQTGTTYNVGTCLLPNTTYYWRVVPKNANGSATGCATWSFTTDGKLNIYANDWETASAGFFGTSGTSVDGWYTNNNSGTGGGTSGYNNTWTVGNGVNAISGMSVGVSALNNNSLGGNFFQYWSDLGEIHRWIYRPFDMRGLRDIEVTFRWKAGGENNQDYGSVISSVNSGTNWAMDTQGGLYNDGKYWNSPSTIRTQSIIFPATRNNQQNFVLGFKWDDMSGNGISLDPSFVVDDIVIKACPYEGNIISDVVGQGIYEWTPITSTQAVLTINESHTCAQFQWEQSTDDGATWANVTGGSGATTVSYTTPSNLTVTTLYRCKVYFGTGCTGVYQGNSFKINLTQPCDAKIVSVTPEDDTICGNTGTTITAVANDPGHEIRWYDAASNGSVLYTGDTFTTPVLTSDTTYYVAAYDGTCESDVRTPVTIEVNAVPASVNVAIGTPANGTAHHINVSWTAISGAWQYQIDYSWNNTQWFVGGFSTTTSYSLNLFDNPDREVFIRVKRYDNGGLPDCFTYADPIYTAADNPGLLTFGTVTGTSVQVIIPAETPVANPAHTTYSLYNETLGLYVQADGSLGATEVFQTKTAWSSTPVTGLDPETEYCFYAKAKNQDGDIRYEQPNQILATQEFNSNVLTTGGTAPNNTWFAPNSQNPINYFNPHQYICDGGGIGYDSKWNNYWGNFVRLPQQDMTGLDSFDLTFTLSNSFTAGQLNNNFRFYIHDGTSSHNGIALVTIGNNTYSPQGINNFFYIFDELRQCEPVTVTFDISGLTNKSNILVFIEANSGYNNSNDFYFFIDNVSITEGGGGLSACVMTGSACEAEIVSVTGDSGCGDITLTAVGNSGTTEYRWYEESDGEDYQTTTTGELTVSGLSTTTSYWVAAYNGTCESDRVQVTATYTPTDAEMMFWTDGAVSCSPAYTTLYAETMDDGQYVVNWYIEVDGVMQHFHTGYELYYYITDTVTLYVAASDGECESPREPIQITMEGRVWNGSINSNWNTTGNWTPAVVPTINECVTIPATTNDPVVSGNAYAKVLTILEDASLLVQTGASITVQEEVNVDDDADFTLENNGYLVQITGGQTNNNVGNITIHRHSEPMFRLEATGWGSPVENQKLYEFSPETVFGRIYEYNETDNVFVNTNITLNSVFVPAKGYSVRAPNGFPTYSGSATPEVFEGVFYGRPNNGTVGINVTFNTYGNNYIGNPYPSPIDADQFLENNSSLEALYFWTHEAPPISGQYAANNYATYTDMGGAAAAAGGAEPDGIINVGQGFVAKTNQSVLIQFTNDLRLNYSDNQFFRQANTDRHRFWLNLSDEQADYNQILVGYKEGASYGFDHKTDGRFFGHNGSAVYSLIEQDKYTIQGRWPFVETDVVPLGFRAIASGSYNISLEKTDGMFADGQIIFVEDMQLNIIHNLTEDGAYHFVSEAGTFDSRFNIVYQNSTLSTGNPNMTGMDWIAYQDADQIFVKSVGFDIENIEIYDLTGRLLIQEQDINTQSFSVPALFAEQVLIVKVNKTMVKKINYNN